MDERTLARFESKYVVEPNSGCWLWTGSCSPRGYGALYWREENRPRPAHVVSYEHFVGPVPCGMVVCHHCDVTGCVNPQHLFLGTQADNLADMRRKGRHAHKVSPAVEKAIAAVYWGTDLTQYEVADMYGVSQYTVSRCARKYDSSGTLRDGLPEDENNEEEGF